MNEAGEIYISENTKPVDVERLRKALAEDKKDTLKRMTALATQAIEEARSHGEGTEEGSEAS